MNSPMNGGEPDYVAKSRRTAITFCRRSAERDDFASALLPANWAVSEGRTTAEPAQALIEDGWGQNDHGVGETGPATIRLYTRDEHSPSAVVEGRVQHKEPHYRPIVDERDIVELVGNGVSCVFSQRNWRHLVAVIESEGKCAVLECYAPAARFEEFRSLFLYVARSLRAGKEALKGVGEEQTVAVSCL